MPRKFGLNSMNLHDLITLMILPPGTLGTNEIKYLKYTSEYIPKLQIHQQYAKQESHGIICRNWDLWD